MLSDGDKFFITHNMSIELASIEERLNAPCIVRYKKDIELAISKFIEAINSQVSSALYRYPYSLEESEAEKFINEYAVKLSEEIEVEEAKCTLDSLRHAFVSFAYNGLHQLYSRQENEGWYPKVILTDVLEPNDIDTLNEIFSIYRGCDKSELDLGKFGQSWSTCEQVASEFAFAHYKLQDWYKPDRRVVLRATYCKKDVLFSDQTKLGEYEIAVKKECLRDVEKQI